MLEKPVAKLYYIFGGLFLAIGLVILLVFVYLKLTEPTKTAVPIQENPKNLQYQLTARLEQEALLMPAKPVKIEEKCLTVPIEQSVMSGSRKWEEPDLLSEAKAKLGRQFFYDFYYRGILKGFEERKIDACWYYRLSLFGNGVDYYLNIPKGLLITGRLAKLDPGFLKLHLGENLLLRLQYFSQNRQQFSPLKIVEWEIKELTSS